jgi:hypothetical protein
MKSLFLESMNSIKSLCVQRDTDSWLYSQVVPSSGVETAKYLKTDGTLTE